MLKIGIATTIALALAGCASTNHVLANEPTEVFHTAHSPSEVAACFSHRNHLRVIERPDGARVIASRNGYGGVTRTFSIYPEGTGSKIESRNGTIGLKLAKWKRCVGLEPMQPGDMGEDRH